MSWVGRVARGGFAAGLAVAVGLVPAMAVLGAVVVDDEVEVLDTSAMERTVDGYLFAADGAAARALAQASGEPVESVADRSERTGVFHLPDGTLALGESSAVQWVRAEDAAPGAVHDIDGWVPVDTTLVEVDGVVRPLAAPGDLVVSPGGPGAGQDLVAVTAPDGTRHALGWEGDLPEPVLDGPRAVYPDAAGAGIDLVLEVGTTGVEVFFVVRERPVAELVLPVQVASQGEVRSTGEGGLELLSAASGEVSASMGEPLMWDAVADADRPHPVTQPWVEKGDSARRSPAIPDWGGVPDEAVQRIEEAALDTQAAVRDLAAAEQSEANATAGWSAGAVEELTSAAARVEPGVTLQTIVGAEVWSGVEMAQGAQDVPALQAAAAASVRAESDDVVPVHFDLGPVQALDLLTSRAGVAPVQALDAQAGGADASNSQPTAAEAGSGRVSMVLRPDTEFLRDPSTVLPAVVDPGIKWEGVFDTWVQSDSSVDKQGDAELRLGTYNNGGVVARSYLGPFNTSGLAGNQVLDGHLALWNWHSYSCSQAAWEIGHTSPAGGGTRWNSQPQWHSIHDSSLDTRGHSDACGDAWVGISLTTPLKWAVANNAASMAWGVKAVNESSTAGWKRFNSANASSGWPYMWVNVADRAPSGPEQYRIIDPSVTQCVTSGTYPAISSTQPTIAWTVKDPDSFDYDVVGNLDIVEIDANGNPVPGYVWDMEERRTQPEGTTFTVRVPAGKLVAGKRYEYRTGGQDVDSGAFGPLSACRFTVDATKPTAPGIAPTATTTFGASVLNVGESLYAGRNLISPDGRFRLAMQPDGMVSLRGPWGAYWDAFSSVTAANRMVLQQDGNLVVSTPTGQELWSSKTAGQAVTHVGLQNDGNLVIWNGSTPVRALLQSAPYAESAPVKPVNVLYERNVERGGIGARGRFELSTIESDVVSFEYSFDSEAYGSRAYIDKAGKAVIEWTPPSAGPHVLNVRAVDSAGNWAASRYEFDVAAPVASAVWSFDEPSGPAVDRTGEGGSLTLNGGATRGTGPHAVFGVRSDDGALVLDGVDDFAVAGQPVVDTRESFTVTAFVKLAASEVGGWGTAVVQEDLKFNGFRLGYRPINCPPEAGAGGCWAFGVNGDPGADSTTYVKSTVPVRPEEWVLLVGEHDAGSDELRISVCEIGSPQAPRSGPVVTSITKGFATPAIDTATGPLVVGRGQINGLPSNPWAGSIDAVRVFDGQVVDPAKVERMCTGAEEAQFPAGMTGALDPTVLDEEVGQ